MSVTVDERSWRRVKGGAAVDLYISAGSVIGVFSPYLHNKVVLIFRSTNREEVELGVRLLRLAGVETEVKIKQRYVVRPHLHRPAGRGR